MKPAWIVGLATALLCAVACVAGFLWYQGHSETRELAADELALARECLTEARNETSQQKVSALLTQALTHARKSVQLAESLKLDAGLVEGEALVRLTKYSAAVGVLEALVSEFPEDASAARLAADAHHQSYLLAKRDQDFGAAIQLYEKAVELGAPADALVSAARLSELAGQFELTDRFLETLGRRFPNSEEQATVKAMTEARAKAGNER